jgi:hypothetical protein
MVRVPSGARFLHPKPPMKSGVLPRCIRAYPYGEAGRRPSSLPGAGRSSTRPCESAASWERASLQPEPPNHSAAAPLAHEPAREDSSIAPARTDGRAWAGPAARKSWRSRRTRFPARPFLPLDDQADWEAAGRPVSGLIFSHHPRLQIHPDPIRQRIRVPLCLWGTGSPAPQIFSAHDHRPKRDHRRWRG